MNIKIAIIYADPDEKFSAKLTQWFTGCPAYHCGFVDLERNKFYDMHLIRRRRLWHKYALKREFQLFEVPGNVITAEFLEAKLDTDKNTYGIFDYALFALRPIFHFFGKSTVNAGGIICSEMINIDIIEAGGSTPWPVADQPPSPCDWNSFLSGQKCKDRMINQ